jgi:hypothetical protein
MITNALKMLGSLRATLVAAAGVPFLIAASAFAQNDLNSAPAAGEATGERIVVTGSYIPTAETVTASPVDTLSQQDVKISGAEDVLTVLQRRNPDFVGAGNIGQTNANIASGGTLGGSVIAIRGFPSLVLFEGRRIADSAAIAVGGVQFSDVNLFPTTLISRIEVLKDGASALYGSEAVGGVVNIFLKDNYQGAELGFRYGTTVEGAVAERRGYLVAGVGNDTTQITASHRPEERGRVQGTAEFTIACVGAGASFAAGSLLQRRLGSLYQRYGPGGGLGRQALHYLDVVKTCITQQRVRGLPIHDRRSFEVRNSLIPVRIHHMDRQDVAPRPNCGGNVIEHDEVERPRADGPGARRRGV